MVYLKFKSPNRVENYIETIIKAYSKLAKASHLTTSSAKKQLLASLLKRKDLQVGQTTANYSDLSMSMPTLLVFVGVKSSVVYIHVYIHACIVPVLVGSVGKTSAAPINIK